MQLSVRSAGAVVAALLLAASPGAKPNSLAWRPHEFDDVQELLSQDASDSLASAVDAERKAQPVQMSLKARRDPIVKLAKGGIRTENKLANPLLNNYLGSGWDSKAASHAPGGEFSTHWNVKTKAKTEANTEGKPMATKQEDSREIPDEANAYLHDLYAEPSEPSLKEKFARRVAAATPTAVGLRMPMSTAPLSQLLGSDMKDAVVTAETWEEEDRGSQGTKALAAATSWGSAHLRGPQAALAASHAAAKTGASGGKSEGNAYMTLLGQAADAGGSASASASASEVAKRNPYLAYFRTDAEKVQDDVTTAEKRATSADAVRGGNSYFNSVVPDTTYMALSGQ